MNDYDDDLFNQMGDNGRHGHEFRDPFIATLVGAGIGHALSKTRWGQRFENSHFVGRVIGLLLIAGFGYIAYLVILYLWILTHQN